MPTWTDKTASDGFECETIGAGQVFPGDTTVVDIGDPETTTPVTAPLRWDDPVNWDDPNLRWDQGSNV